MYTVENNKFIAVFDVRKSNKIKRKNSHRVKRSLTVTIIIGIEYELYGNEDAINKHTLKQSLQCAHNIVQTQYFQTK